mmetsp:Transcript_22580/g.33050  ORF Transcript_22580/g.33050 Transcript_22580/m.33050 type:complete len:88 (-) Transcript_22580:1392-1655(-)
MRTSLLGVGMLAPLAVCLAPSAIFPRQRHPHYPTQVYNINGASHHRLSSTASDGDINVNANANANQCTTATPAPQSAHHQPFQKTKN